jgi:desulfoferrodoxin-like iron-binding protein
MAELNKNYKCSTCGNLVKVLQAGIGELVCCGQPMNIVVEEVSTEQKPMGEESPTMAESTPAEQSTPPVPDTPTEEPSQEEPQV